MTRGQRTLMALCREWDVPSFIAQDGFWYFTVPLTVSPIRVEGLVNALVSRLDAKRRQSPPSRGKGARRNPRVGGDAAADAKARMAADPAYAKKVRKEQRTARKGKR